MNDKLKILYVEDEQALAMVVGDSLRSRGFIVDHYDDGKKGLEASVKNTYDVLVIDVMLPEMDGFSLIEAFRRENSSTPVIFLTARSLTEDVVKGFELGGNDYLKKPFSIEELIVRIKALANRINTSETAPLDHCFIGKYKFNVQKQSLELDGYERILTHRESQILFMLYKNRNQVLERKKVLDKLWGDDTFFNARSMDVFITKLRKYLNKDQGVQIINIRGIGYKLFIDEN
ncbi:DNA-binding response regulator, OmpR family, contains REC and winged-helix (wHTH) domain [Zhouia amylolytica]|uniref:Transcriptional regulatory protein rprY n=2 Tax=Zhouia amylolytica TaxID=376730 RepID=W2UMU0_9FLAO|nr:response regulator transcription factor [Zhouia amylolytica]ETN95254.1 transcriptional regulatory protein rprY [Zhouia amylolytica AD3]SFT14491.1 DNA-binding response regulator, OmpR family, contains REC and winged-helix (wHTH) domain [Zhouia amylolytica]